MDFTIFQPRNAIFLLDCADPSALRTALRGIYNYFNNTVLYNHSSRFRISVVLCHPDPAKANLITPETCPVAAYCKLFELLQMTPDAFDKEFCVGTKEPFNACLLNAMKCAAKRRSTIFYATAQSNPCLDATDRQQTMQQFDTFALISLEFELIPMCESIDFSEFYQEVFATLEKEMPKFYYNEESVTEKLYDVAHGKGRTRSFDLFPYLGCPTSIKVDKLSLRGKCGAPKCVPIHKTSMEVLQKRTTETAPPKKHYVKLNSTGFKYTEITAEQYKEIANFDDVPVGITLIEAKPLDDYSYYHEGFYNHPASLIKANDKFAKEFDEFWEGMKDSRVLAYLKFTKNGTVYSVELAAVKVDERRHFSLNFVTTKPEDHFREPEVDWSKESTLREGLMRDAVREHELADFQRILRWLCPPKLARQREYVKQQLLGGRYAQEAIPEFVDARWHEADDEKVKQILCKLEGLSFKAQGKKRTRARR